MLYPFIVTYLFSGKTACILRFSPQISSALILDFSCSIGVQVHFRVAALLCVGSLFCFCTLEGCETRLIVSVFCKSVDSLFATPFPRWYDYASQAVVGFYLFCCLVFNTILLVMGPLSLNEIISPYFDFIFSNLCTDL